MRSVHPVCRRVHGGVSQGEAFVDACERVGMGRSSNGLEEKQWEELKATVEYALDKET